MTMTIELQPAHGLPVAVAICSCFMTVWAGFGVGMMRKKFGIKYPQMYAETTHPNAMVFNCYQRAHQAPNCNKLAVLLLGCMSYFLCVELDQFGVTEGASVTLLISSVLVSYKNVMENYPQFIVLLTLASVKRPTLAAAAGALRLLGFVLYVKGYRTGKPENRQRGAFGYLGLFAMLGMSVELAVSLIRSS